MKAERWRAEWVGKRDTVWRVSIMVEGWERGWVDARTPFEAPCVIEWAECDKLAPMRPSRMTLRLVSQTDREFLDLYTIEAGAIRADVYRNGALYWSGALDPELYEEPYSTSYGYVVEATFADFSILDRSTWDTEGMMTIGEVIRECVRRTQLATMPLDIATTTEGYAVGDTATDPIDLDGYRVNCSTFMGDDPMTCREVLEAVLQPFGLAIIQKGGRLVVYDLNWLKTEGSRAMIDWCSTDQRLGSDKVYNNITIRFSPGADTVLADGEIDHKGVLPTQGGSLFKTDTDFDNAADGFRVAWGEPTGEEPVEIDNGAKLCRIDAEYSGSDEACVVWAFKAADHSDRMAPNNTFPRAQGVPIITLRGAFLANAGIADKYRLRVSLDVLADVRYNPFESASEHNDEANWKRLQNWANFAYVPSRLILRDKDGAALYHYRNDGIRQSEGFDAIGTDTGWRSGEGDWGEMWLAYYDVSDRKGASGLGGWKRNRPMIGYCRKKLPDRFTKSGEGDLIPLPPRGGYLELQIGKGFDQFDYGRESKDIYSRLRWLLYKNPKIELVEKNGTEIEAEDIEDVAWINESAKEELAIETAIGTAGSDATPAMRGLIYATNGFGATAQFGRAGVNDRLEHLLIGTAYSQYRDRMSVLTGTARLLPTFTAVNDAATEGDFVLLSEYQDLKEETGEIKAVELAAEQYEGIAYEEDL